LRNCVKSGLLSSQKSLIIGGDAIGIQSMQVEGDADDDT